MMQQLKKTSEFVTVVDLKQDEDMFMHVEIIYPQLIQTNNLLHQMLLSANPTIHMKLLENNVNDVMAGMFFIQLNARETKLSVQCMYSILNVFAELAAHPNTQDGFLSTSCVVEALIQHLVLKPKKFWSPMLMPEVANVL